jgi:hypothetical protein
MQNGVVSKGNAMLCKCFVFTVYKFLTPYIMLKTTGRKAVLPTKKKKGITL